VGLLEPCSSPGRFTVQEFFFRKMQRALGDSRTSPGTPQTNRRKILKPVTSLPPSDPHEREPGLHLNRPDCNSTGTTTRPSKGSHGIAQPSSLRKRCVRDILTKSLNWPRALVRTSKDPRAEMPDPRTNLPEGPDGPAILGLKREGPTPPQGRETWGQKCPTHERTFPSIPTGR
jgi:hypothetical protein